MGIMALHRIIIKNAFYPRLLTINNAHSGIKDAARASTFALKSVTANNSKPISGENFEAKNKRMKSTLSPHLSIYNFETTMAFSITHRFTGLALNGMLYGIAAVPYCFQDHALTTWQWLRLCALAQPSSLLPS